MKEKLKENIKVIIIALAISIFICIPYLQTTSIDGDDISYHISRFASIAEEIKLGNFPIAIHSGLLKGCRLCKFNFLSGIVFIYSSTVVIMWC